MILFRADGNKSIGSGHIMRCLSIAKEAMNADEVKVITADNTFHDVIQSYGISDCILHTNYTEMENELELMRDIISSFQPKLLFVDSYYVTERYLSTLKTYCNEQNCRLIYIDDMLLFPYPCDVLINYNVFANKDSYIDLYESSNLEVPKLLLGTEYAPLRSDFANIQEIETSKVVKNVLISTGGTDPIHLAISLAKRLREQKSDRNIIYHLLIGAMNFDKNEIEKLSEDCMNIAVHFNVSDMRSLICSCDIAVSAAGCTLYEICACGVPLITYILADNQINNANSFGKAGLAINCGDLRGNDNKADILLHSITKLIDNYSVRTQIHDNMTKLVDGKGVKRIINAISTIDTETR